MLIYSCGHQIKNRSGVVDGLCPQCTLRLQRWIKKPIKAKEVLKTCNWCGSNEARAEIKCRTQNKSVFYFCSLPHRLSFVELNCPHCGGTMIETDNKANCSLCNFEDPNWS